jgi:hypothetical protein
MRRLLHVVFVIASLACFGACAYALYWIWVYKKPAIDTTTYAFQEANKYLVLADDAMVDVTANLEVSRAQIQMARVSTNADASSGGGFFENMLARALVRQLTPNVNNVQHTVEKVTEASIVVNSILEAIPDVPLDPADRLNTRQVRGLQQQIHGVTEASWELGELLNSPQPGDPENASTKAARISANLALIIEMTSEFQKQVRALQARARRIEASTLYWLNWFPTIASWTLGWIMLSQVLVIMYVIRASREAT